MNIVLRNLFKDVMAVIATIVIIGGSISLGIYATYYVINSVVYCLTSILGC